MMLLKWDIKLFNLINENLNLLYFGDFFFSLHLPSAKDVDCFGADSDYCPVFEAAYFSYSPLRGTA